jgi:hypothetical protein
MYECNDLLNFQDSELQKDEEKPNLHFFFKSDHYEDQMRRNAAGRKCNPGACAHKHASLSFSVPFILSGLSECSLTRIGPV